MYFVHPQIPLKNLFKLVRGVTSNNLDDYFPGKQVVFTDMGRSAFKIIIEKLKLEGSDLLMPAYTCSIFTPILEKYNIRPIFLDIDLKTFHIKTENIAEKITPKTKAILVCHTYGLPFNVEKLRKFNLLIIEDCAHAFSPPTICSGGVGNAGDAAFFSLYKQFPTLRGGMLVCPKDWDVQLPQTSFNFRDFVSFLNYLSFFAFLFKKFGSKIAPRIIKKEKMPEPSALNKISLVLFFRFLSLDARHRAACRRQELALFFQQELKKLGFEVQESQGNVFCLLSTLVPKNLQDKRDEIVKEMKKHEIFCARIWKDPIVLDKEKFPHTFEAAQRIINFPLQSHYTKKDVKKMITALTYICQSYNSIIH